MAAVAVHRAVAHMRRALSVSAHFPSAPGQADLPAGAEDAGADTWESWCSHKPVMGTVLGHPRVPGDALRVLGEGGLQ